MKQKYFIVGVTNDQYELPKIIYENMDEMQKDLGITRKRLYNLLYNKCSCKDIKMKYFKIMLGGDNDT